VQQILEAPATSLALRRICRKMRRRSHPTGSQIIEEGVTIDTPAGRLKNCLRVYDTDGLDVSAPPENKIYCHGIGHVVDENLIVTKYGRKAD
jgi:hypothetical protein